MRLIGYSCRHPEPPLADAYLPLRELTVLLGRNDAGKSSLLRAIGRDLAGGHFAAAEDDEAARLIGGVFFAQASEGELNTLIGEAARRRKHLREISLTRVHKLPVPDGG